MAQGIQEQNKARRDGGFIAGQQALALNLHDEHFDAAADLALKFEAAFGVKPSVALYCNL